MYQIEFRLASKNGYHTPAEAQAYYKKYSRSGITWHWWGDGGKGSHDGTVNYILNKAANGAGSVNFVLSNDKITCLVDWRNVAWASQSGNPVSVSVELQTFLGDEGYKKAGWLKKWLKEQGNGVTNWPHNYWYQTQCPGTISLDRIEQEYQKWMRGEYNPIPPIPTPPATADLEWVKWKEGTIQYVCNKQPTNLWDFNKTAWNQFSPVKAFNKGEIINIVGECNNKTLNAKYLVTEYSFDKKITNGFNAADMDVYVPPRPTPEPPEEPETPEPPYQPDWVKNLRDIDDTTAWFSKDEKLWDIVNDKPALDKNGQEILFAKDEPFTYSALTVSRGKEYRITEYSRAKGIFNGVLTSSLTLTKPNQPDVPPVPENPDLVSKSVVIAFLESIVKLITDFIAGLRR